MPKSPSAPDTLRLDEGDAVLGKRTTVKDSSDRYANIELVYADPPAKADKPTRRR